MARNPTLRHSGSLHRRCRRRSAEWRDLCRQRLNTIVVAALEVGVAKDYAAAAALRRGCGHGGSCGVRGGAACATAAAQLPFQLHPVSVRDRASLDDLITTIPCTVAHTLPRRGAGGAETDIERAAPCTLLIESPSMRLLLIETFLHKIFRLV